MRHMPMELSFAIRQVIEIFILFLLVVLLLEQRLLQSPAMARRNELVALSMDYHYWALCFLYTLDVVEMLAHEEGEEAAGNLGRGLLDCGIGAHEDEGTWLVLSRQQASRPTSHRSSEHNNILAVEPETALIDWLYRIDEHRASAQLDRLC